MRERVLDAHVGSLAEILAIWRLILAIKTKKEREKRITE